MFKNVLVIGQWGGQTKQRINVLKKMGYKVDFLNEFLGEHLPGINYKPSFFERVWNKLGYPCDIGKVNQRILLQLQKMEYQLIFVEKCLVLKASTLKKIHKNFPSIKIAWYSADDMMASHNQSKYFLKALPYYDIFFTTKSYNCNKDELPRLGAKRVVLVGKGFDYSLHSPRSVSEEEIKKLGGAVGFIGTYEKDRAEKMLFLAKNGIKVHVWGNGWSAYVGKHPNLSVKNKPIYEEDYQKSLCATKINLCFLRKINRDLQTDRSVEIPACGAFMLAERTSEHQELFLEDKEAVFFDIENPQELLDKVHYYLKHEEERKKIALAGRQRCLNSGYSHEDRFKFMMGEIEKLGVSS